MKATELSLLQLGDMLAIQYHCCPGGGLKYAHIVKLESWGAWAQLDGEQYREAIDSPSTEDRSGCGWWRL